jgi:preprotein translocase SecF subunit
VSDVTEVHTPESVEDIPGVTRRHRISDVYHERTNFQFIKHSRRWAIMSAIFMIVSILLLIVRGLNFGIDFKGGTEWQVEMQGNKKASVADVRDELSTLGFSDSKVTVLDSSEGQKVRVQERVIADPIDDLSNTLARYGQVDRAAVQFENVNDGGKFTFTTEPEFTPTEDGVKAALAGAQLESPEITVNGREVQVNLKTLPSSKVNDVAGKLAEYAGAEREDVAITTVGPTWGRDVTEQAIKALVVFFLLLALYLSIRFEFKMAISAIVAVIHDIFFTIGFYALFQFQITPATVTAFLTILGFSLYDTVVVFDKVSELQKTLTATGRMTYSDMVNRALNAVLMRSLSTSLVALLPVMSLLVVGAGVFGATALEDFAIALAVGLFIGSYSSIFVAAPLLAWWKEREPEYQRLAERRGKVSLAAASASVGVPAVAYDDISDTGDTPLGIPGPPAVPRGPIQPRARQQRGRKRK